MIIGLLLIFDKQYQLLHTCTYTNYWVPIMGLKLFLVKSLGQKYQGGYLGTHLYGAQNWWWWLSGHNRPLLWRPAVVLFASRVLDFVFCLFSFCPFLTWFWNLFGTLLEHNASSASGSASELFRESFVGPKHQHRRRLPSLLLMFLCFIKNDHRWSSTDGFIKSRGQRGWDLVPSARRPANQRVGGLFLCNLDIQSLETETTKFC